MLLVVHWRREFAFAVTAILGEKELAFLFFMSGLESCYIACPNCENCDEEIEFGYCNPDERTRKAEVPAGTSEEQVSCLSGKLDAVYFCREKYGKQGRKSLVSLHG